MTPQGSSIINADYYRNVIKQIESINSCSMLQEYVDEVFAEIKAEQQAILDQIASLNIYLGLLNPPKSLSALIRWVGNFITAFIDPNVRPILILVAQLSEMVSVLSELKAAISTAADNIRTCSIDIPGLPSISLSNSDESMWSGDFSKPNANLISRVKYNGMPDVVPTGSYVLPTTPLQIASITEDVFYERFRFGQPDADGVVVVSALNMETHLFRPDKFSTKSFTETYNGPVISGVTSGYNNRGKCPVYKSMSSGVRYIPYSSEVVPAKQYEGTSVVGSTTLSFDVFYVITQTEFDEYGTSDGSGGGGGYA